MRGDLGPVLAISSLVPLMPVRDEFFWVFDLIATTVLGIAAFSLGYAASAYTYRAIAAGARMAADGENA